jgi:anti-sigma-K factor RskA
MGVHEQFAEDLALYALDALAGEDRERLEQHLAGCAACQLELQGLRGDGALLALSTMGPKPPQRARPRLLDAVSREPRVALSAKPAVPRRSWWGALGWMATAAVLVFAASLWMENSLLRERISRQDQQFERQQAELRYERNIVSTLTSTSAMKVTLVAAKTPPQPQGKAFYLRDRGSLVFLATNMPALPPQKAYELWLIPTQGAPIPAGVFKPDSHGSATLINPPLPAAAEAKAFAVTMENEAGASAPTSAILMVGAGE